MDNLYNIIIPGVVSLAVVAGGYFANSKLGIAAGQRTLVETLKDTVSAQRAEIDRMKSEMSGCKERLEYLETTVDELKAEEFQLRTELSDALRRRRTDV